MSELWLSAQNELAPYTPPTAASGSTQITWRSLINRARLFLHDQDPPQRLADTELLAFAIEALHVIGKLAPHYFQQTDRYECVSGDAFQKLLPTESFGLIDVIAVEGGTVVRQVDRRELEALEPGWMFVPPGNPVHWMPVSERDPLQFYLYPRPGPDTYLLILHAAIPARPTIDAVFPLQPYFEAMVIDYIVARGEQPQGDDTQRGKAEGFIQQALARLQGGSSASTVAEGEK